MKWVKNDLDQRKDSLPELMEHVRLPLLASTPFILKNIVEEPLLKNSPKCKCDFLEYAFIMNLYILFIIIIIYLGEDFVIKALDFNLLKSVQNLTISQMIWCKPRQFGVLRKVRSCFD